MYGIRMLSAGMEKLTGEQIQRWLERMTGGRLRSALFGTIATALIHRSGLLMVTMIGPDQCQSDDGSANYWGDHWSGGGYDPDSANRCI